MRGLVVPFVALLCVAQFEVSNGQRVLLEYLSETCYVREIMDFQATVNTTGFNGYSVPYYLVFYLDGGSVCSMAMSNAGCYNASEPYCSYCVQQDDENYFVTFTISTVAIDQIANYNDYYFGAYCIWRDSSYNFEIQSNNIQIPIPFTLTGYTINRYNWRFEFLYTSLDKTSPAMLNKTTVSMRYSNYLNATIVIGDSIITTNNYDGIEFPIKETREGDIAVFAELDNCSYTCEALDYNLNSLHFQYDEESKLLTVSFETPASSPLILLEISLLQQPNELFNWSETLNSTWSFGMRVDLASPVALLLLYSYNTSFCKVDEAQWIGAIPKAEISSDCPSGPGVKNGYIRRGTTATCKCQMVRQSRPAGYVQWFTEDGQSVGSTTSSEVSVLILFPNTTVSNISFNCIGLSEMGQKSFGTIALQFADEPKVINFSVNGSKSVSGHVNNSVTFYCQVEADPPARAVLTGSGLGKVQENTSASDVLELTLNDLQCEDSGRYFCSGRNGFEDNATSSRDFVNVNVTCAPKLKNVPDKIPSIQVSPNQNTVFTLEVYGYPEPTEFGLKIETGRSTSAVNKDKYSFTYLPLTPPFGLVTLTIYDANTKGTTTYILSVRSEAGEVEMKLEVVKEESPSSKGVNVSCVVLVLGTATAVCAYVMR